MSKDHQPSTLARFMLGVLHWVHFWWQVLSCCIPRQKPGALDAPRRQIPKHVALLLQIPEDLKREQEVGLVADDMVECIRRVSEWCMEVGIETLSVYDKKGLLKLHHDKVSAALSTGTPSPPSLSTNAASSAHSLHLAALHSSSTFPITPPPSDGEASSDSSAASISPVLSYTIPRSLAAEQTTSSLRRRTISTTATSPLPPPLRLNLICREQGKPALARAAQYLSLRAAMSAGQDSLQNVPSNGHSPPMLKPPTPGAPLGLTVQELNFLLEPEFAAPDLLIVHPLRYPPGRLSNKPAQPWVPVPSPLELSAFPPWQIRLSEIFYDPLPPKRFFSLLFSSLPFVLPSKRWTASCVAITENEFCRALDEFAKADMKVGK